MRPDRGSPTVGTWASSRAAPTQRLRKPDRLRPGSIGHLADLAMLAARRRAGGGALNDNAPVGSELIKPLALRTSPTRLGAEPSATSAALGAAHRTRTSGNLRSPGGADRGHRSGMARGQQ